MLTIPISLIIIAPNRQRTSFDGEALAELRESITTNGLLHPPVLRDSPEGMTLVAGERRIRAIQDMWMLGGVLRHNGETIPEGMIPYTTLGQLSTLEAEEAELDENLRRVDLSWQEKSNSIMRLEQLRNSQRQEAAHPDTAVAAITSRELAIELTGRGDGSYQAAVTKNLIVAKHLDDPDVQKAKSVDDALKVLRQKDQAAKNRQLAVEVGETFSSSSHTLLNGSCLELLSSGDFDGQFDVICTDPPYGMGADKFGDSAGRSQFSHNYDDSPEAFRRLMEEFIPVTIRVTKPSSHCYMCCDIDQFHYLREAMRAAGWNCFRTPLIHYKTASGRVPLPEHGPRRQYELILYCYRGGKQVTHIYPDVIPSTSDGVAHAVGKPVSLFQNLLQRSVRPGDRVLDCFAGSGGVIEAGHNLQCKVTAIELDKESFGQCLRRLELLSGGNQEVE